MQYPPATASQLETLAASLGRDIDISGTAKPVNIYSGGCHITNKDEMLTTILGSCVSACIRDPMAGVAGMNHFLLPDTSGEAQESLRYGAYAMEVLINGILKEGGRRERMEVKVFGGANVLRNNTPIGARNAAFVTDFLKREGLGVAASHLGGETPRRVHYFAKTGRVMLKALHRTDIQRVASIEEAYQLQLRRTSLEGEVDLF